MTAYKKLNNQPLKFVLAEFRFSPVMQIVKYIPDIQEALRKQYPIHDVRSEQTVQVQPGNIAVTNVERWAFISINKKSAIEINQERLIYITAEYPRFDGFSDSCKQAIIALAKIVEPTLITRIGLRYSDLIIVDNNENITQLVTDNFGMPSCIESLGETRQHSTQTFLNTSVGTLSIRTLYGKNNLTSLPDTQGLPISIIADTTQSERMILDFDHFWEAKEVSVSFDTNEVLGKLAALHDTTREAFWKVTTDYARNMKWA